MKALVLRSLVVAAFSVLTAAPAIAQLNVNSALPPDPSAALQVTAGATTKKGFLPPSVALASVTDATTVANPATGLIVYNTNASITNGFGVGLYMNTGTSASPSWGQLSVTTPSVFVPTLKVVANATTSQISPGGGGFNKMNLQSTSISDGGFSTATSTYTVPAGGAGYYQIVASSVVSSDTSNNAMTMLLLVNSSAQYQLATVINLNVPSSWSLNGIALIHLNAGDTVVLGNSNCNGCSSTAYTYQNSTLSVMKVSN